MAYEVDEPDPEYYPDEMQEDDSSEGDEGSFYFGLDRSPQKRDFRYPPSGRDQHLRNIGFNPFQRLGERKTFSQSPQPSLLDSITGQHPDNPRLSHEERARLRAKKQSDGSAWTDYGF